MSISRTAQFARLAKKLAVIRLSNTSNKQTRYKRTMFYELKNMGGVYFKCLQIMSVTHKFLEGWAGPKEMSVFSHIPTEHIDIEAYVGDTNAFKTIEQQPFAAGSFAQVYKGELQTGEAVAIKILRPSIAKNLRGDLKYLRRLAKLFTEFLPSSILDYRKVVEEFCHNCLLETDYSREIENMKYFYNFYKGHAHVVVPKVYEEFSNATVIVQDFIAGPTFADVLMNHASDCPATKLAKQLTGSDLWTQLIVAGGEALRMAMQADYVFGDPHPGNIKLLPNNRIAFIDFGIIANRPTSQMAFYQWVSAYKGVLDGTGKLDKLVETTLNCFCSDIAIALNTCNMSDNRSILGTLAEAVAHKFDVLRDDSVVRDLARNGHFFRLFTDALDSSNALNVKLDTNNFQLIKAMQSYLGSLTVLDDSETRDRFAPVMLDAMKYALWYAETRGVASDLPLKSRFSNSESCELLFDTLSSLAENDQFIFNYVSGKI